MWEASHIKAAAQKPPYFSTRYFDLWLISLYLECDYFRASSDVSPRISITLGFWSALIGSIALSVINSLIFTLLGA
ncbi:MAG: hypothetical protein RLZZ535_362 [Cyanobacteriota bacterium]|jgi:uncharacterized membrane protein YvlD (DUF360 family)